MFPLRKEDMPIDLFTDKLCKKEYFLAKEQCLFIAKELNAGVFFYADWKLSFKQESSEKLLF